MYLLRYGEIFLKSDAVRRRWEEALIKNIRIAVGDSCNIRKERGRIWLWLEEENDLLEEKLKKIFGIVSFSKCKHCKLSEINDFIIEFGRSAGLKEAKTFAIRVKRVGIHDFTSQQKASELGSLILKAFPHLKVDLEHPNKEIFVEIRNKDCYIFDEMIEGAGGIPIGVEGKLVSLFSGSIDSSVATLLMMKRGCEIIPVYFDIFPFTAENAFKRTMHVAKIIKSYLGDFELRVVKYGNFIEEVQEKLKAKGMESYTCALCKRRMYKIAEEIAKKEGGKGLVTGENLGQVASQFDNLLILDNACLLPVYRPLIGFDRVEIEKIAKEMGVYEASMIPKSGCMAVPKKPTTKARLEKVLELEEEFWRT